jgi:TolA-binding protein
MRNKRVALLVLLILATLMGFNGCRKRAPAVVVAPPAPVPVADPVPPPPPPPIPEPPPDAIALEEGERAFEAGTYHEAIRAYSEYLRLAPLGKERDLALFRLGVMSTLLSEPGADWASATTYFKQLVTEFPQSPLALSANLILNLHSGLSQAAADVEYRDERIRQLTTELSAAAADSQKREERIRQLSSELEKLKQIDAERRKRP